MFYFRVHLRAKLGGIGNILWSSDQSPLEIVRSVFTLDQRFLAMPVLNVSLSFTQYRTARIVNTLIIFCLVNAREQRKLRPLNFLELFIGIIAVCVLI